jgi:hypothetical protein
MVYIYIYIYFIYAESKKNRLVEIISFKIQYFPEEKNNCQNLISKNVIQYKDSINTCQSMLEIPNRKERVLLASPLLQRKTIWRRRSGMMGKTFLLILPYQLLSSLSFIVLQMHLNGIEKKRYRGNCSHHYPLYSFRRQLEFFFCKLTNFNYMVLPQKDNQPHVMN